MAGFDAGNGVTRPKRSRREELRRHATAATARADRLPGAFLSREVLQRERSLGGVLLEAGVAFRLFLWLVPFGLVVAALLSLWSEHVGSEQPGGVRRR